jgi:type I restriction enzyme, S subunit
LLYPRILKWVLKYGRGLPAKSRVPGKYPVYGSNGIVGSHEAAVTHCSTIIVGRKGSIGEIHLSSTACWPIDTTYYIDDFHDQPEEFLVYLLKYLNLGSYNRATAIPGLTREEAYDIPIPLPPLNEQRRIVAKLNSLFARSRRAREQLARVSGLCDRYKQAVLAAAFRGDLTADWREENPDVETASELLKQIQLKRQEKIGLFHQKKQFIKAGDRIIITDDINQDVSDIPITWSLCKIGDIGDVCNGSTPSRKSLEYWNGNINWVSSGEVRNNIILKTKETITKQGYDNSSVRTLPVGTVLLAMIGEGKTRGQTAILRIEATINQNIAGVIIERGLISSEHLWYWFQYQYKKTREQGSGSGPQALNCQRVRELPFIVPPLEEQKEIVQRVEKLFKAIALIEQEYQKACQLCDRLEQATLAKAFRGELVPQDPNDEPAAALLERIRAERQDQPKDKAVKSKQKPREQL